MKMNRKSNIAASIVIVLLLSYLSFQYGNYYSSPLESIENYNSSNGRFKQEIELFSIGDKPLIFYISQNDEICLAHFKMRKFGDELKYKVSLVTTYEMRIEDVKFEKAYNTSSIWIDEQKTNAERILFGISTPTNAAEVVIDGKKPVVKPFKLSEKEYVLWYIIGGVELDNE